jgi:hypothetical protein
MGRVQARMRAPRATARQTPAAASRERVPRRALCTIKTSARRSQRRFPRRARRRLLAVGCSLFSSVHSAIAMPPLSSLPHLWAHLSLPATPLHLPRPPNQLHRRSPRRNQGRSGHGCRAPPSTTAGTSFDPSNHRNGTLGEPTPLSHPFPAKPGLPLARIPPSSPLAALGTTLQSSRSFQRPRCKNQRPVRKS